MKRMFLILLFFVFVFKISMCFGSDIDGIWKTNAYNLIIEIKSNRYKVYEITEISCLRVKPIYLKLPGFQVRSLSKDSILLEIENTTYQIIATRIKQLPEVCNSYKKYRTKDPILNFEVFIQTFKENYAFSQQRSVDWEQIYSEYSPGVLSTTTKEELFDVFTEIAASLNDIHLTISDGKFETWHNIDLLPSWFDKNDAINTQNKLTILARKRKLKNGKLAETYEELAFKNYIPVIKRNYLHNQYTTLCNGNNFYSLVNDSLGYICVLREDSYIEDGGDDPSEGLFVLDKALDKIISDLKDAKTIIVDARFNLGGADAYSVRITERFAKERKIVLSKQAFYSGKLSPKLDYEVNPDNKNLFEQKSVYFLISGLTVSGGENLAIAMSSIPNVTFIGETTMGALSDMQTRHLPNGWIFTVSNEIFYSHDNKNYEIIGFEPDIRVKMNQKAFKNGIDNILERAIEIINNE
ncbi:MAG: S41 family peptidase [Bacteroidales bacterium]|nr:S41 family peptidase [Bacteroidales bacterium]